ncbi:TOBE domain-containing protein [Helicobacter sp. 13S00477-4]|uniref:TOBE domain-containing protein n=1 Tax=Helicobacter sp. 13S00477-4 TaxID=1905759 RepID=UPI000BA590E4|nr:TOBE domain-containing protein [Helicobacter sp. 13S00477-4]PAF52525.1 hypothetical protein BKH44_01735 [Helicobacter sp. 13S00477-4]
MNRILCKIESIFYDEGLIFIRLRSGKHFLSAMLLESQHILEVGREVYAIFKETEVMVCDEGYSKISARNRFVSRVVKVELGGVIARVIFMFEGREISSLISLEAYRELEVGIDKKFGWFVKSSEVMLEYV